MSYDSGSDSGSDSGCDDKLAAMNRSQGFQGNPFVKVSVMFDCHLKEDNLKKLKKFWIHYNNRTDVQKYIRNDNENAILFMCQPQYLDERKILFLIQEGFNINYLGYLMGWTQTPLMMTASNGNINIVKMLLDNGADINIKGKWGKDEMTAIDWAIQSPTKSKKEIFDLLIDKNPEITDETIYSAKEVLESTKYNDMIKNKYQYFYNKLIEIPTLRELAFQMLSKNDKNLVKNLSMLPLNGGKKRNRKKTRRNKKKNSSKQKKNLSKQKRTCRNRKRTCRKKNVSKKKTYLRKGDK